MLEWATRDWKAHGHGLGIVRQANTNALVDVRFADDILMFEFSIEEPMDMLRSVLGAPYECVPYPDRDVEWQLLLRILPGPDWSMPWHRILHSWNRRVESIRCSLA